MYTMYLGVRQGSVERLELHPDGDAFLPFPYLFPRVNVEYVRTLHLRRHLPNHRKDVADRDGGGENARHVPENRGKLRQRAMRTRLRLGRKDCMNPDFRIENGARQLVLRQQFPPEAP